MVSRGSRGIQEWEVVRSQWLGAPLDVVAATPPQSDDDNDEDEDEENHGDSHPRQQRMTPLEVWRRTEGHGRGSPAIDPSQAAMVSMLVEEGMNGEFPKPVGLGEVVRCYARSFGASSNMAKPPPKLPKGKAAPIGPQGEATSKIDPAQAASTMQAWRARKASQRPPAARL
mmetsp:Transcript_96943/g.202564  ORF Transcript_96943/g.202564 Transcript_96943/m.202564 type:complete len:171 (-) Transcript_96943:4-516(-)